MTIKNFETMDGNEAVARVAFQLNEVVALFPITPASPMGEWADAWARCRREKSLGNCPGGD
jgi:pyruvate-ferredoxin/flavodoxin oxidoreductase